MGSNLHRITVRVHAFVLASPNIGHPTLAATHPGYVRELGREFLRTAVGVHQEHGHVAVVVDRLVQVLVLRGGDARLVLVGLDVCVSQLDGLLRLGRARGNFTTVYTCTCWED